MNDELRPSAAPALGESFEDVVLPHLDAAYRLARWLMRNEHDAEDVVQEASLRALRWCWVRLQPDQAGRPTGTGGAPKRHRHVTQPLGR